MGNHDDDDDDDDDKLLVAATIAAGLVVSPTWIRSYIARGARTSDEDVRDFLGITLARDTVKLMELLEQELDR